MRPSVCVLGRFPPPIDGQTMATARLAELLAATHEVHRINTSVPEPEFVQDEVRFSLARTWHYARRMRAVRQTLASVPNAPVLWTSISPVPLGHARDLLTVYPFFQPEQPVYAVIHRATFDDLFRSRLTRPTGRRLVQRLQGFVFLNEQLADRCAPWIPAHKRLAIPNTIDARVLCTEAEVTAKQAARKDRTELRLLFLSNMIPSKGHDDVLRALPLLGRRGVGFHATFAGRWMTDEDRHAFEQFVARENLTAHVTHLGPVHDRARIKQLHLEADIFLLPSYHPTEAQPLSILEALNAGTPVITTRHGGIPDMVRTDQETLFVPPRDPQAIADAVERLADLDTWRPFATAARQRFISTFSPDAVRQQWLALIGE